MCSILPKIKYWNAIVHVHVTELQSVLQLVIIIKWFTVILFMKFESFECYSVKCVGDLLVKYFLC